MRTPALLAALFLGVAPWCVAADPPPRYEAVAALLKTHCVKCHGPGKREAGLNLATAAGVRKGAKDGPVVAPHDLSASSLWGRVAADEMPPEEPLSADDKSLLKLWIEAGAPGLPASVSGGDSSDHWAFRGISVPPVPAPQGGAPDFTDVDRFLQSKLEEQGISLGDATDKGTQLRRLSLVLTGIPPAISELDAFLADQSPQAFEHAVDRYLASPRYGERWGKYWLDAAGYSDSNGYFNADSDRPLAWKYRDWVVRAFNADVPFDQFVRMQIAGDELAKHTSGEPATPETIDLLTATHYLRNGQDGTGESDGNPDEVKADKYFALESCQQNVVSSLLGLTIQCAKCHDHKFEPVTQLDFYRIQAVFYPAFHIEHWQKPNERVVYAPLPGETEKWRGEIDALAGKLREGQAALREFVRANRPRGEVLFRDTFENGVLLAARWSNRAPGDDAPAGKVPVHVDSQERPGAFVRDGSLVIAEGNTQGDSALCSVDSFDWTPDEKGASMQVTFDLISNRFDDNGSVAERIGYLLALHDFDDSSSTPGGNLLVDGHPTASTAVHLDYPGADSTSAGVIGTTGYSPGHNYGVRITALGDGKFKLEHLVDNIAEEKSLELKAADLPKGGFAFEYCCNRSFVVDNVLIERFPPTESNSELAQYAEKLKESNKELAELEKRQKELETQQPGKLYWVTDMAPTTPEVHLMIRGNYSTPGEVVAPGAFSFLTDPGTELTTTAAAGTRLAFADWVTRRSPRAQALMARVQMNRMWQHVFGAGIVATTENLGYSGAEPSHPELLDWLAARFVAQGFHHKAVLRELVLSRAFRQSSATREQPFAVDPANRLIWRFSPVRLDAEAVRDSLLAVSGALDETMGGPYIPSTRAATGEVVVPESDPGSRRRSLYLYQRRTQMVSLLQLFDAPQIVFNSTRRPRSTIPLQSLALLNGEFAVARARDLAKRLTESAPNDEARIDLAWRLCYSRSPQSDERADALRFLDEQTEEFGGQTEGRERAWRDLCQLVLAGSESLYLR